MKALALGELKGGINRMRVKGGASAKQLYDLKNGYVDQSGTARSRPGTVKAYTLPAGTVGLCYHAGKRQVFAVEAIDPGTEDVQVNVLRHPDDTWAGTIKRIHYAEPFLGYLYVAAEFNDYTYDAGGVYRTIEGGTYHYWLQDGNRWGKLVNPPPDDPGQPYSHYYPHGAGENDPMAALLPVAPDPPDGYIYKPASNETHDTWAPGVKRKKGDVVVPTERYRDDHPMTKDFKYEVVEVLGDNPASGEAEPKWATSVGDLVYEYADSPEATTGGGDDGSGGGDDGGGSGGGSGGGGGPGRPPIHHPPTVPK